MILLETITLYKLEKVAETLLEQGTHLGLAILKALVILIIGRFIIKFINKAVKSLLIKENITPSLRSFLSSLVNVILIVLLIISVIGALGIQTTSFAALLASAGVAIGMALSGNLSNFAGGVIILLFKPFKIGDYISSANVSGTVTEIQIFHTILNTPDNIQVYIPNGTLSSGFINNYNVDKRRVEWVFGVDYGVDYEKVQQVTLDVLADDNRILSDPAPFVALKELSASSVNIIVRVWVISSDYWSVYFDINKNIYEVFNQKGINFPFPQLTIHQADKE